MTQIGKESKPISNLWQGGLRVFDETVIYAR